MSRPAHFLDPYQFQIEEMVKLGCTDEHICRVLEDITGKEVKKRVIANKRMWLRKMENKRKQYEPYKGEIKYMIEYGLTIQNIYAAISEESGIDASIETFKNFLKDNVLWSSIFVTLMANKIGGLQFGIYRNCQISSRVFHTAVAALPLTKANRSDFE